MTSNRKKNNKSLNLQLSGRLVPRFVIMHSSAETETRQTLTCKRTASHNLASHRVKATRADSDARSSRQKGGKAEQREESKRRRRSKAKGGQSRTKAKQQSKDKQAKQKEGKAAQRRRKRARPAMKRKRGYCSEHLSHHCS